MRDFPARAQILQDSEKCNITTQHLPLTTKRYLAFCALGNPENFFEQLRREDFNLVETKKFPDHHFYTQNDVGKLEKLAEVKGAEILLTTAKDAVKLKDLRLDFPCFVVENELVFEDMTAFCEWVLKVKN